MKKLTLLALLLVLPFSCEKEEEELVLINGPAATPALEATRELALQNLTGLHTALVAEDYEAAIEFMKMPPNLPKEKLVEGLSSILRNNELSAEGIAILAQDGKWGKFLELNPQRGASLLKRWELEGDECYMLALDGAQAGFHWTGENLLIIRCDDIGKLGEEKNEELP